MIAETIKEVKLKSIMDSKAVATKKLGDLTELGLLKKSEVNFNRLH